uniref:Uncharacterized protein n=1 Tax=Cacopsylla melanoneura TaxID=428564 RepID=A0A8D8YTD9_9HEMI
MSSTGSNPVSGQEFSVGVQINHEGWTTTPSRRVYRTVWHRRHCKITKLKTVIKELNERGTERRIFKFVSVILKRESKEGVLTLELAHSRVSGDNVISQGFRTVDVTRTPWDENEVGSRRHYVFRH